MDILFSFKMAAVYQHGCLHSSLGFVCLGFGVVVFLGEVGGWEWHRLDWCCLLRSRGSQR